ncbi:uncharacterized protein F5891DRAFT_980456 [Suillus fuscotomentosus]|uniref:Uncharacterized protein n=1 Tax=Suillus fuscotomentosus TaxID=1912939 RepID=A0AAD4E5Y5_9AGAM|nr:uncharacterized protein F5891DRAFT_980456 [Suillus fuscotomentosus]KAG1900172.1 hypothetical protein F5891DRAFT_980456 [Suillus fuscotomentosus]
MQHSIQRLMTVRCSQRQSVKDAKEGVGQCRTRVSLVRRAAVSDNQHATFDTKTGDHELLSAPKCRGYSEMRRKEWTDAELAESASFDVLQSVITNMRHSTRRLVICRGYSEMRRKEWTDAELAESASFDVLQSVITNMRHSTRRLVITGDNQHATFDTKTGDRHCICVNFEDMLESLKLQSSHTNMISAYHSMVSSPVITVSPAGASKFHHCAMELPTEVFTKRSVQDDTHHDSTKHPYDDHSWVLEPTGFNKQSSEESLHGAAVLPTQSLPNGLPPVSQHLSLYAKRASRKFRPYQRGGHVPTALEHRFMMKNMLKRDEADGEELIKRGLRSMPDATVHSAIAAKRADAESKHLRALATAWELESAEKHAILLQSILRDSAQQYAESKAEASFLERMLVRRSMEQLEDDADFSLAAYSHDLIATQIADLQLDFMEEVGSERKLPLDDTDSEDAKYRLDACLDSILADASNFSAVTVA